jgi:hypothetical protein
MGHSRRAVPAPAPAPAPPVGSWLDEIDVVAAVRGCSSGFSVLVVGGLIAPALAQVSVLGSFALVLTAIAGFSTAAARQGASSRPALQGVLAAVGAYLLALPLVVMVSHAWDVTQIAATLAVAVCVGALVGPLSLRLREVRSTGRRTP